jgi:hypothetical protein
MPAELPFKDTVTDEQGNAVSSIEKIEKRGRRKKIVSNRMFAIHSAEGCFICNEDELVATLAGKSETDVYILDKKVKSIVVVPGKKDLLGGTVEKDAIEITTD